MSKQLRTSARRLEHDAVELGNSRQNDLVQRQTIVSRVEASVAILMWLVQDTGKPEALEDTLDPLFPQSCGKQCNGLV
ncbi:hypothetical protein [Bradyrhizobium sp. Bra64]|uniref:hypothetical protein n=1 Tax=Bradyrhizobium sp. Bra64 TaxID=2926009 RepID=UPI002119360B|nr:hypothetical protein [Bradyrhizobium sp. Bra64]